jgi:hypothetical protein
LFIAVVVANVIAVYGLIKYAALLFIWADLSELDLLPPPKWYVVLLQKVQALEKQCPWEAGAVGAQHGAVEALQGRHVVTQQEVGGGQGGNSPPMQSTRSSEELQGVTQEACKEATDGHGLSGV